MSTNGHDQHNAPVKIGSKQLTPCCCLDCRDVVWFWPHGARTDGRAFTFDFHFLQGEQLLSVHDCRGDLATDHDDDPDWGWVDR